MSGGGIGDGGGNGDGIGDGGGIGGGNVGEVRSADSLETTHLRVSANQWRSALLKASVGTGVPRGICEDIADAGIALLAMAQDPVTSLLGCLETYQHPAPRLDWPQQQQQNAKLTQVQVLHHGPSVIDMVQSGIHLSCEVDEPLLLLGLAQARQHSHGTLVDVQHEGGDWQSISVALSNATPIKGSSTISLRLGGTEQPLPINITGLASPTRKQWQQLQTLTEQILVPADDTNRADAGAGLTDND